jgi:hypothetical protein
MTSLAARLPPHFLQIQSRSQHGYAIAVSVIIMFLCFRSVTAPLIAAALAACANPYVRSPEAGISPAVAYREPKPSTLVTGNYCGVGTRTGDLSAKPVDRLDAACLDHDACYIEGRSQLDCNREMIARLKIIIADPAAGAKMRASARRMAAFFSLPFFHVFPHGLLPPRDPKVLAGRYRGAGVEQDRAAGLY